MRQKTRGSAIRGGIVALASFLCLAVPFLHSQISIQNKMVMYAAKEMNGSWVRLS